MSEGVPADTVVIVDGILAGEQQKVLVQVNVLVYSVREQKAQRSYSKLVQRLNDAPSGEDLSQVNINESTYQNVAERLDVALREIENDLVARVKRDEKFVFLFFDENFPIDEVRDAFADASVRERADAYLLLRQEFDAHFGAQQRDTPGDLLTSLPEDAHKESAFKEIIENRPLENFIVAKTVVDYLARDRHEFVEKRRVRIGPGGAPPGGDQQTNADDQYQQFERYAKDIQAVTDAAAGGAAGGAAAAANTAGDAQNGAGDGAVSAASYPQQQQDLQQQQQQQQDQQQRGGVQDKTEYDQQQLIHPHQQNIYGNVEQYGEGQAYNQDPAAMQQYYAQQASVQPTQQFYRLRGMPFNILIGELLAFLDIPTMTTDQIAYHFDEDGMFLGNVFVNTRSPQEDQRVKAVDRKMIGKRFAEVLYSSADEFASAKANEPPDLRIGKTAGNGYVKLRGLPWKTRDTQIRDFFKNLPPLQVEMLFEEQLHAGEALVVFQNTQQAQAALQYNMHKVGDRYVEIYISNIKEFENHRCRQFQIRSRKNKQRQNFQQYGYYGYGGGAGGGAGAPRYGAGGKRERSRSPPRLYQNQYRGQQGAYQQYAQQNAAYYQQLNAGGYYYAQQVGADYGQQGAAGNVQMYYYDPNAAAGQQYTQVAYYGQQTAVPGQQQQQQQASPGQQQYGQADLGGAGQQTSSQGGKRRN